MNGLKRRASVLSSAAKAARLNPPNITPNNTPTNPPKPASQNAQTPVQKPTKTIENSQPPVRKPSQTVEIVAPSVSKISRKIQPENIFHELLSNSGVTLSTGNPSNEIDVEKRTFQSTFLKSLKQHRSYPEVIKEFLNCVTSHLENETDLIKFLTETKLTTKDDVSGNGCAQDSLVRMLLEIEEIQPGLVNIVLEKLVEFSSDEEVRDESKWSWNIPRLILSQFRFLNRIVEHEQFKQKMLEVLSVSSINVQREIICCVPDTIADADHEEVGRILMELFQTESRLTIAILDCLSNMVLSNSLLKDVQDNVLKILNSVQIEQLPMSVKFLLHTARPQDAGQILDGIRKNLDFACIVVPSVPLSQKKTAQQIEKTDYAIITVEAIQSGINNIPFMADACLKLLESITSSRHHRVLDIFLIFILFTRERKKAVFKLLTAKIKKELIDHGLLSQVFVKLSNVAQMYGKVILSIANEFLPSPNQSLSGFGAELYKLSFAAFDMYHSQEVLGQLVIHIGSGINAEVNAALDVLIHLVGKQRARVLPCAIFIQGVLDYLDLLNLSQIRKVYQCLAELAYGGSAQESPALQVEMPITVRKQLASNVLRYKCIGVVGSLMITKSVVTLAIDGEKEEQVKDMMKLIQLTFSSVQNNPQAKALFMDELSDVIQTHKMNKKFLEWLSESVTNELQESFITELDEDAQPAGTSSSDSAVKLKPERCHGIDPENTIIITLLPLILNEKSAQGLGTETQTTMNAVKSSLTLIPHFRLVRVCEQAIHNGKVDEIDALLGCPLYFYSPKLLEDFSTLHVADKQVICKATFLCVNWFRELLNAFCNQADEEMRKKVLRRLRDITRLHQVLAMCLTDFPDFVPALAIYDFDQANSQKQSPSAKGKGKGKKKTPGKTNKKKGTGTTPETQAATLTSQKVTQTFFDTQRGKNENDKSQKSISKNEKDAFQFDTIRYISSFRELEFDVFTLLDHKLYLGADDDEIPPSKITPLGLHFLLQDLNHKFDYALRVSAMPVRFFNQPKQEKNVMFKCLMRLTPNEIAKKGVTLLPAICQHLELIYSHFKLIVAANDGIMDGPGMFSLESKTVMKCYLCLLEFIHELFSWNGFKKTENEQLLEEACQVIASRISNSSQTTLPEKIKTVQQYFTKFSDTVPQFSTAVAFLKLLETLGTLSEEDDDNSALVPLCETFLKREWQVMKGAPGVAEYNANLQFLLRVYLQYHKPECWDGLEKLATEVTPQLVAGQNRESNSAIFPSISRLSFVVLYRAMMGNLVDKVLQLSHNNLEDEEYFLAWNIAVRVFQILVNVLKEFDGKTTLSICLNKGVGFIENFLKCGMPLMGKLFPTRGQDVEGLFKNLQLSTRYLQHVCAHSKVIKDVALTRYVPRMKKALESIVYRVQAMLAMNKCAPAFWVGNLKHRNLQGEEISSQIMRSDDEAGTSRSEVGSEEHVNVASDVEDEEKVASEEETEEKGGSDVGNDDKERNVTSGDETDINEEESLENIRNYIGRPSKSLEF